VARSPAVIRFRRGEPGNTGLNEETNFGFSTKFPRQQRLRGAGRGKGFAIRMVESKGKSRHFMKEMVRFPRVFQV